MTLERYAPKPTSKTPKIIGVMLMHNMIFFLLSVFSSVRRFSILGTAGIGSSVRIGCASVGGMGSSVTGDGTDGVGRGSRSGIFSFGLITSIIGSSKSSAFSNFILEKRHLDATFLFNRTQILHNLGSGLVLHGFEGKLSKNFLNVFASSFIKMVT